MESGWRGDKISSLFEIFARNWQTTPDRGRCFVYPSIRTGIFEANGDWDEFEGTMLRWRWLTTKTFTDYAYLSIQLRKDLSRRFHTLFLFNEGAEEKEKRQRVRGIHDSLDSQSSCFNVG